MPHPLVHIGFHKTATKWFQEAVYPLVKSHVYIPRARVQAALLGPSAFHFDADEARACLEIPPGTAPILCEENLSGYLHNGGLLGLLTKEVAQRVRATLPDAHVVVVVRAQPEMVAACYQQYVRGGGTYSAQRYLWPADFVRGASALAFKAPRFSFDHFEYDRVIAHYQQLFGPERVHAYAYEQIERDAREFLRLYAREHALDLDVANVPLAKRNASYSRTVNQLSRILNRFTARSVTDKHTWLHVPYLYRQRRRLIEAANATGVFGSRASPDDLLGAQTVAWIRQRYWE
ncbi:MAG: hypothetical protein FJ091_08585 [Deltaproteobacteria bacterium]|nr:hypothetical protein [Deltaproteobacteria bacterium]